MPNQYSPFERMYFYQRGSCFYCQVRRPYKQMTRDHFYPKSKGHKLHSNCVIACGECNHLKGDKSFKSFRIILIEKRDELIKSENYLHSSSLIDRYENAISKCTEIINSDEADITELLRKPFTKGSKEIRPPVELKRATTLDVIKYKGTNCCLYGFLSQRIGHHLPIGSKVYAYLKDNTFVIPYARGVLSFHFETINYCVFYLNKNMPVSKVLEKLTGDTEDEIRLRCSVLAFLIKWPNPPIAKNIVMDDILNEPEPSFHTE